MRATILLASLLLTMPGLAGPSAASWRTQGSVEPDTTYDTADFMQQHPQTAWAPRIYFNAVAHFAGAGLNPNNALTGSQFYPGGLQGWYAYFGVWRDCNADGYVGLNETGIQEYRNELLLDKSICPPDIQYDPRYPQHNAGGWVREFLWIGRPDSVGDQDLDGDVGDDIAVYAPDTYQDNHSLIWGDYGLPGSGDELCPIKPPQGATASTGGMIDFADCHINRRVANYTNFIDSEIEGAIGLSLFRFDDPTDPETSESLLNQDLPYSLWGNPHAGPGEGVYAGGLLEDGNAPGGAENDAAFRVWDCGGNGARLDSPMTLRLYDDGSGALRGRLGTNEAGVTLFDSNGRSTVGYDEGETIYELGIPRPSLGDPTGSYYDAINNTYDGSVDSCEQDDGPIYPPVESGASHSKARRENDIVFFFEGHPTPTPQPIASTIGVATPPDLGLGHVRAGRGLGWIGQPQTVTQPQLIRGDGQPSGAQYATFYAYAGPNIRARGFSLPGGTGFYGTETCGTNDIGIYGGWDCDIENWYKDETGVDIAPREAYGPQRTNAPVSPWGPSRVVAAYPGQVYNLRDVDCFDGTLVQGSPAYASLQYLTDDQSCDEAVGAFQQYWDAVPELDEDFNGLGDAWQSSYHLTKEQIEDALRNGTDFDGDGAGIVTEFKWDTAPIQIPDGPNAPDYDNDNWKDGEEIAYWNANEDPDVIDVTGGVAYRDPDSLTNTNRPANDLYNQHDPDSDSDDLIDGDEYKIHSTYPEFKDSDCELTATVCTLPTQTKYGAPDRTGNPGTGDGAPDAMEIAFWEMFLGPGGHLENCDEDSIPNILDGDSDSDGVRDGDEILAGTDPCENITEPDFGIYDALADTPLNQDLDDIESTMRYWVENGIAQAEETVLAGLAPLEDPFVVLDRLLETTDEVVEQEIIPPSVVSFASAPVDAATDCTAQALEEGLIEASPSENVRCLLGALNSAPIPLVDGILRQPLNALPGPLMETVDRVETIVTDPLFFVPPAESILPLRQVAGPVSPTDPMPTPPVPWSPSGWTGTPLEDILWADTPYPQFLGSTIGPIENGALYQQLRAIDELADPLELVSTVDATHYSVLVQDETTGYLTIATARTIGTPVGLDIDRNPATGIQGIDVTVQALYAPGSNFAPAAQVIITREHPGVQALVAGFLQIPNEPRVIALGADGTTAAIGSSAGLPAKITLTVSATSGLVAELLGQEYGIRQEVASNNWPTRLVASMFLIDDSYPTKTKVPGHQTDLTAYFPSAPTLANLDVRGSPQDPAGLLVNWEGSEKTSLIAAGKHVDGGPATEIALGLMGVPAQTQTTFHKSETDLKISHSALDTIDEVWFVFKTDGGRVGGGGHMYDVPATVTLDYTSTTHALLFESSSPLGLTELTSYSAPELSNADAACRAAEADQFFFVIEENGKQCTTLRLHGLTSAHAQLSGSNLSFDAMRNEPAGRLVVDVEHGGTRAFLDVSSVPTSARSWFARSGPLTQGEAHFSAPIDGLNLTYQQPGDASLVLSAIGIPNDLAFYANRTSHHVEAHTSPTPLGDLNIQYYEGTPISLANMDGIIYHGDSTTAETVALRIRQFGSANFDLDPSSGVTLTTASTSPHPFFFNWSDGQSAFAGMLPRLPANVVLTYDAGPSAFDLEWTSSEPIMEAGGHIVFVEEGLAAYAQLSNFPTSFSAHADFATLQLTAVANAPIGLAEVALARSDSAIKNVPYDNYVELDRLDVVQLGTMSLPSFHVKLTGFKELTATFDGGGVELTSEFTGGGSLGVDYRALEGWFELDATKFPANVAFSVDRDSLTWDTTPGSVLTAVARGRVEGFEGSFTAIDLPSHLEASWTRSGNYTVHVEHNGASVPLLDLDARLSLGNATLLLLAFHAEDLQAQLDAYYDDATERFAVTVRDANGMPSVARRLQVGIVTDADQGWPIPRNVGQDDGLVYIHRTSDVLAFDARFLALRSAAGSLQPDQNAGLRSWVSFDAPAASPKMRLQVTDTTLGDLRLAMSITAPPQQARLEWTDAADALQLEYHGSSFVPHLSGEFERASRLLRIEGELPRALFVNQTSASLELWSSDAFDIRASYAPVGEAVEPATPSDYIVARIGSSPAYFAINLHGLEEARITNEARITLNRASAHSTFVDVQELSKSFKIFGNIANMPGHVAVTIPQNALDGSVILEYSANARGGGAALDARVGQDRFRVDATGIPSIFSFLALRQGETSARATLATAPGESFDSLEIGYTDDATISLPELPEGQAVKVHSTSESTAIAARIEGISSLDFLKAPTLARLVLHHRAAPTPIVAHIETPESGSLNATIGSLPQSLYVTITNSSADQLDASVLGSSALSSLDLHAVRGSEEFKVDLESVGAGLTVQLWRPSTDLMQVAIYAEPGPGGAPYGQGDARTVDGFRFNFTADELPADFTIAVRKADGQIEEAKYEARSGAFSGDVLIAPLAGNYYPTARTHGASLSTKAGQEHVWLKVEGAQILSYQRLDDGSGLFEYSQRSPTSAPFEVVVEDNWTRSMATLSSVPSTAEITWTFGLDRVLLDVRLGEPIANLTFGRSNHTNELDSIDATIKRVPTSLHGEYSRVGGRTRLEIDHEGTSPDVTLAINTSDRVILADVVGVPGSLRLDFDTETQPAAFQEACRFVLDVGEKIDSASVTVRDRDMPQGAPNFALGTPSGGSYFAVVGTGGSALYARVTGLGSSAYCEQTDGQFAARVDTDALSELRFQYVDELVNSEVRIAGISTPGEYSLFHQDRLTSYVAPGNVAEVRALVKNERFDLEATLVGVPRNVDFGFYEGVMWDPGYVTLSTRNELLQEATIVGHMTVDAPEQGGSSPAPGPERFEVRAGDFAVDRLKIALNDPTWPSTRPINMVTFQQEPMSLGVKLWGLIGTRIAYSSDPFELEIPQLQVTDRRELRAKFIGNASEVAPVELYINKMPSRLEVSVSATPGSLRRTLASSFTVADDVDLIHLEVKLAPSDASRTVVRLHEVPGGATIPLKMLLGTAIKWDIAPLNLGNDPLGGLEVGYEFSDTKRLFWSMGRTRGISLEADLDGATNLGEDDPVFFDFKTPMSSEVEMKYQDGNYGFETTVRGSFTTAGLVGVIGKVGEAGLASLDAKLNKGRVCAGELPPTDLRIIHLQMHYEIPTLALEKGICSLTE